MECSCGAETQNKTTQRDLKPEANFDECVKCGRVGNALIAELDKEVGDETN